MVKSWEFSMYFGRKNPEAIRKIREISSQNMLFVNQGIFFEVKFRGFFKITSGCIDVYKITSRKMQLSSSNFLGK